MGNAPSKQKHRMFIQQDAITAATVDPVYRFYVPSSIVPLALRLTPLDTFTFDDLDESYVISLEDDGTKISTDNGAVTAANNAKVLEATFDNKVIAAGSYVEIVLTLAGTSPSVPALSVFEFEYLEG